MNPIIVMLIISRLKKKKEKHVPIVCEEVEGTGLEIVATTKNPEGKPLFHFVNRLDYIKHLEQKHALFQKRGNLRNALRNSLRK
jgi:hypothetical protein